MASGLGYIPTARSLDGLRRLTNPENALEVGKAAEHLVVADLIICGYRAFLSDQGLPYDVIVDVDGRLLRLQVKATCFPRNVNCQARSQRHAYTWNVRRRGKSGSKRLTDDQCDFVALVALDIRAVAYMPVSEVSQTVYLDEVDRSNLVIRGRTPDWKESIHAYTFERAIAKETAHV